MKNDIFIVNMRSYCLGRIPYYTSVVESSGGRRQTAALIGNKALKFRSSVASIAPCATENRMS